MARTRSMARTQKANDRGAAGVIAERRYRWQPPHGKARSVYIRIGPVLRSGREWACRLQVSGLPREKDYDSLIVGGDALGALELALYGAGRILADSPEFRAGQVEGWGTTIRDPIELGLPLPLLKLQNILRELRAFLERSITGNAKDEWRRGLLITMDEILLDVGTLAARVRPRRRKSRY